MPLSPTIIGTIVVILLLIYYIFKAPIDNVTVKIKYKLVYLRMRLTRMLVGGGY